MTLAALMLRDRIFAPRRVESPQVRHAGRAVRQRIHRRHADQFRRAAGADGRRKVGLDDRLHAFHVRLQGGCSRCCSMPSRVTLLFRRELCARDAARPAAAAQRVPASFVSLNLAILAAVVFTNHDPEAFMGLFLLFLGLAEAYRRHHDRLLLREGLMVAFFLAGLVVLGGQQQWWLQDVLSRLDESTLFYGAAALTAITDNAALTYLGSLVEGVSEEYKYSLVAGAVAGRRLDRDRQRAESGRLRHPEGLTSRSNRSTRSACSSQPCRRRSWPIACFRGIRKATGRRKSSTWDALGAVVRATGPLVPVPADPAVRGRCGRPLGALFSRLEGREVALGACSASR